MSGHTEKEEFQARRGQIDTPDNSPLINAILRADETATQNVLKVHADLVNNLDSDGCSALHYASAYNEVVLTTLLIDHGANLQLKNRRGNTPLHSAVANGAHDTIRLLIEKDPSLALITNQWKESALHIAAHSGDILASQILLGHNSSLADLKDSWDRIPLDVAKEHGEQKLIEYLQNPQAELQPKPEIPEPVKSLPVTVVRPALSKRMEAPLHDETFLGWLRESQEEVNGKDFYGYAAVHKLAAWNKPHCLEALLAHPHFNTSLGLTTGPDGNTPLNLAIESIAKNSVQTLLAHEFGKQSLTIVNNHGVSPAQMAVSTGDPELIQLLAEATGVDVQTLIQSASTPAPEKPAPAGRTPGKLVSAKFQDLARLMNK